MTDCKNLDLARQWADGINAGVPVLAQAGHRAAAEVIRDLPDAWVDAEKLREVVADHHIDMSEELMEALGALLPAPTPPTLADMTPEEREACVGMQADVESVDDDYRSVIAYVSETVADIVVIGGRVGSAEHSEVTPLPDLPRLVWPGNEPEETHFDDLPDEWVDADTLRKFVEDWRAGLATAPRGNYESEMLDDLEDMLPAPPKPADPRKTLADMTPAERRRIAGRWCEDQTGNLVVYVRDSLPAENGNKWGESALVIAPGSDPLRDSYRPWLRFLTPRYDLPPAWTPDGKPLPGKWLRIKASGVALAESERSAADYERFTTDWMEARDV